MAKYTIKETSEKLTNGKAVSYPKMVKMGLTSSNEFAQLVKDYTGFSPSIVKGVLDAVSFVATNQMGLGFHVQIGEFGILSPKLGVKAGVEREKVDSETKRNGASVEVVGINFRADKSLVLETQERIHLQRVTTIPKDKPTTTLEERLEMALKYIDENSILHIRDYAAITGLERTRAGRELKRFAQKGSLQVHGRTTHIYYTRP